MVTTDTDLWTRRPGICLWLCISEDYYFSKQNFKRWATFLFILLAIWLNFCLQDFSYMSFNLYKYAAQIELCKKNKNDCMNRIKSPLLRCGPYSCHALHGTWTQDISTFCCGLTPWVFCFWLPCYDACTSPVCDKVSRQQPVSLF